MEIEEIKLKMKSYKDFFGGDLLLIDEIDNCSTKEELVQILNRHISFIYDMAADAESHLNNFKNKLGLDYI